MLLVIYMKKIERDLERMSSMLYFDMDNEDVLYCTAAHGLSNQTIFQRARHRRRSPCTFSYYFFFRILACHTT